MTLAVLSLAIRTRGRKAQPGAKGLSTYNIGSPLAMPLQNLNLNEYEPKKDTTAPQAPNFVLIGHNHKGMKIDLSSISS